MTTKEKEERSNEIDDQLSYIERRLERNAEERDELLNEKEDLIAEYDKLNAVPGENG